LRQTLCPPQQPVEKHRSARGIFRLIAHPVEKRRQINRRQARLLEGAPRQHSVTVRRLAQPLHRAADAQQTRELVMHVARLEFSVNHLARHMPVRRQRREPGHEQPLQALMRRQLDATPGAVPAGEHGRVGAIEPGVHDVLLFAEMRAQRRSDPSFSSAATSCRRRAFPRAPRGEIERRIDDSVPG
jgi:hypothetical protein